MNALVTGGGGFLGKALVKALLARGDRVRSFARGDYPELRALGAETVRGDLADYEAVKAACTGCEVVFHVAALVSLQNTTYDQMFAANVTGTENVIRACRELGIQKLVYTSTPSVIFSGQDIAGADEALPYPARFGGHYASTKAQAEQMVLAANGPDLATVALRPPFVWGPGDTSLFPRIVERARAGRMIKIGGKPAVVDTVYVDNAVHGHLLAAEKLAIGSPVGGKVYFITDDDRVKLFDMVDAWVAIAGAPPITRVLPRWLGELLGAAMEGVYGVFRPGQEPPLSRFVVQNFATDRWFDISAAKRDLGYAPVVSRAEGLRRLDEWYKSQGANSAG